MKTREEAIAFCAALEDSFEDYPFHDDNWALMRHKKNRKAYACIYERLGNIWINVKCDPQWRDFWRDAFTAVVPAYHMNKKHWNSIILNGSIPEKEIKHMIQESYDLTKPKEKNQAGKFFSSGEKKHEVT